MKKKEIRALKKIHRKLNKIDDGLGYVIRDYWGQDQYSQPVDYPIKVLDDLADAISTILKEVRILLGKEITQ